MNHFLTGFPGFLGSEYIRRRVNLTQENFYCLIQEKFLGLATAKRQEIENLVPGSASRIHFVLGDLCAPHLGLPPDFPKDQIEIVEHFAAVYDLNVSKELGQKINVEGTARVLEFCKTLPNLKRLHYVSTCYVSGKHKGVFKETDLNCKQKFNNYYEATKYQAELLVRDAMKNGLTATIYRPAIVVGDSKTGATQKFDGPYYVIQWLLRQKVFALLPKMGTPERFTLNLVPSDFVLDSLVFLSLLEGTKGMTFQLADPKPLSIDQMVRLLARLCERHLIQIPLPLGFTKALLTKIPGLEKWLGIPRSSLDYFVHPTTYDTSNTARFLSKSGIECPRFETYALRLIAFQKANSGIRNQALI